jgi:uncharacterized protein
MKTDRITFRVSESIGDVSAEALIPNSITAALVLAHGAGANMDHRFMKALADALADRGIATLRFNFPFMEKKKGRPDPPAIAEKAVSSAVEKASQLFTDVPLFAGGKSFGGRMTSQWASKNSPGTVRGLIFFGFPLHAPGKPSTERAAHLYSVSLPMLFLQGTRDALANAALIGEVTSKLPTASLKMFEGADHSFAAGKRDMITELANSTSQWIADR